MSLELTGTLVKFYETKSFPSGFSIQEFVVRTDERYPQEILVQAAKEKIGNIKTCPACGSSVKSMTSSCEDCGHEFTNVG